MSGLKIVFRHVSIGLTLVTETLLERDLVTPAATIVTPISVIVPCFNESGTITALSGRLAEFRQKFRSVLNAEFIFVDDGSSDSTATELEAEFGDHLDCQIIRHPSNRGIAAAIMTGILAAKNEVVVSMDSDCTYDPLTIDQLIAPLTGSVVLVTGSPYHPLGKVVGVPSWRLGLSRCASSLYRRSMGVALHTYTSCFRAYRRSFFLDMHLEESGFVGIAELLWQTACRGGEIVEVPAVLSTRKIGHSKLKTIPVIRKHLSFIRRIRRKVNASA